MNQIRTDCTDFELRKNEFENGLCETDGHYLCRNCKHLAPYELMSEWDNKRAYYIFGANDPAKRDGHSGTNVLWDAFYDLSKLGINEVDVEGVNSPHRGWFKLSFGGNIIPYYEMKWIKNEK